MITWFKSSGSSPIMILLSVLLLVLGGPVEAANVAPKSYWPNGQPPVPNGLDHTADLACKNYYWYLVNLSPIVATVYDVPFAVLTDPSTANCMSFNHPAGETQVMVTINKVNACLNGYDLEGEVCTSNGSSLYMKTYPGDACGVGNPINPTNGNKFQIEVDYKQNSGLEFKRTYNSAIPGSQYPIKYLGFNWRSNYDRSILIESNSSITSAYAYRPNGKLFIFNLVGADWIADPDVSDRLEKIYNGVGVHTGWKYYHAEEDELETYDLEGKLLTISDRNSLKQTLTYSDASTPVAIAQAPNLLIQVNDPMGRALNFTYDAQNRIKEMIVPGGSVYKYKYDNNVNNNLITVTYPDNNKKEYLYSPFSSTANSLRNIRDENGDIYSTFAYDSNGRAISTQHANEVGKYLISYVTNGFGNVTSSSVTDPLGTVRTYTFTNILGGAKESAQSQPGGAGCGPSSADRTYDSNGNIASVTDFNGIKTSYVYDLNRNLQISRTEGLSSIGANIIGVTRTITTIWHPIWRLPTQISEYAGDSATGTPTRRTSFVYDVNSNLTTLTEEDPVRGLQRTTSTAYTYSSTVPGLILSRAVNGPRSDVNDIVSYTYYDEADSCVGCRGQLKTMTDGLGHLTSFNDYNHHGQLLSSTDQNGIVTTNTYDLRQRLLSRTVGTETISLQYDPVGQLYQLTMPDGSTFVYTYDAAHRLTSITDSLGNSITYTLDAMGNRIQEDIKDHTGSLKKSLSRGYDALNRLQILTGVGNE